MRPPISFIYGNCVFASGKQDCWAAFALEAASYAWLSDDAKRTRMLALVAALEALEADLQIVRASQPTVRTRACSTTYRSARRAAPSSSGWCAGRSVAASASLSWTPSTNPGRWPSSATARPCWRRWRLT